MNEIKISKKDKEIMNWILKFTIAELNSEYMKNNSIIQQTFKKTVLDTAKRLLKKV